MMKHKRKSLSKKSRFDTFKRDEFTCQYCGNTPPSVVLEIDHVEPISKGGSNDEHNLLTSCFDCNRGKGANELSSIPKALSEKSDFIREKECQIKAYRALIKKQRSRVTRDINKISNVYASYFDGYSLSDKFKGDISQSFLPRLDVTELEDSMHMACCRVDDPETSIQYFCGICWNKIKS